ncbi:MAG TPA: hypothetical protein VMU14_05530 [Acidimicrobiales bacterium]|nr:hypothetical protein [Acidimicrobiales bacterium]
MASLEAQLTAVLLPSRFHARTCGRLCVRLRPAPVGSLTVSVVRADGTCGWAGQREVGVFGAVRDRCDRWLVALATADGTWFHGEYTDARVLRQRRGDAPEPLRSILTAELIVLQ